MIGDTGQDVQNVYRELFFTPAVKSCKVGEQVSHDGHIPAAQYNIIKI